MSGGSAGDADAVGPEVPRRARGRPPRISREQIVAAARSVAAEDLTMQAVADALGVSRKALHYYVGDRQGLLTLVVLDLFESGLARVELPFDSDWRTVLRAYAVAYRDGVVEVGSVTTLTQFRGAGASAALALGERVLEVLLAAGFTAEDARRGLTAVSNIAQSSAQSAVLQASTGSHPHHAETTAALQREPAADTYPALRRVLAAAPPPSGDAESQFWFEVELAIAGLDKRLRATSPS
jgi:AcrR family transcriptional regulator